MYITWSVTDDLSNITLSDFEKEYNGIYGFFSLEIGDNKLGERAEESFEEEGYYDISYYLGCLIKCGIAMKKQEKITIMLLDSVLAQLVLSFDENVTVSFTNLEENEIYWSCQITKNELIEEIEINYQRFIGFIKKENPTLLTSYIVKRIIEKHADFQNRKRESQLQNDINQQ